MLGIAFLKYCSPCPDQLIHHHPMNSEVLKRSEAVALQIAVANGHSTPAALLQQFAGALQTKQRETLLMILKVNGRYRAYNQRYYLLSLITSGDFMNVHIEYSFYFNFIQFL